MVIIISYNKQTWNEYNDSQTADENLANGAIISADRLNNMETGISNNDINKVTDNQNGTEQLNGVQVQPFNKLSDTIGGVNYIKDGNFSKFTPNWTMPDYSGSGIAEIISDDTSGKNYYHWRAKSDAPFTGPSQTIQQAFSQGDQLTLTLTAHADQATNMSIYIHEQDANGNTMASGNYGDTVNLTATDSLITWHWAIRNDCDSLWIQFSNYLRLTNDYYITNVQLEKGSIATDWAPAPEDKVNVSDMRKPASDVAGIEEVNAKQDKIGYTPADFSKVVHSTVTNLNSTDMNTVQTAGFYRLISGTNGMPNVDAYTIYQVIPLHSSNGVQLAYGTNNAILGMRSWNSYHNFTSWVQFADDSKVAHLSGANNFDTVPTYGTNNKPFAINDTGATTARPTGQAVGYQYFDTTLNKPIWYNGANWVDSTGTTV